MISLEPATDAHFAWLIRAAPDPFDHLAPLNALIDEPDVLGTLRDTRNTVTQKHKEGSWLIVRDGIVVGLCGFKAPPDDHGQVEIGYGVREPFRKQRIATSAVACLDRAVSQEAHGARPDRRNQSVEQTVDKSPASKRLLADRAQGR